MISSILTSAPFPDGEGQPYGMTLPRQTSLWVWYSWLTSGLVFVANISFRITPKKTLPRFQAVKACVVVFF